MDMAKKYNVTDEDVERILATFADLNHCNLWSRVTRQDFTIRRFPLGFVNDISCCELTEEARKRLCHTGSDYGGVVVKYVPKESFFAPDPIEAATILTVVAENGLGPKTVYISEECYIQAYIESSRTYSYEDDCHEETVGKLARLLARFHALKPPVSKRTYVKLEAMFNDIDNLPIMEQILNKQYLKHLERNPEFKDKYYDTLNEIEIKDNSKYLRGLIGRVKTAHVFIHRDFNRGNRLVTIGADGKAKQIYLVDYDYSCYNHRGYDFGRYFSNFRHQDDMFGNEGFPTDAQMELFLGPYIQECACIHGPSYLEDADNSMDQLRLESKLFTMDAYFGDVFFALHMYLSDPDGPRNEHFLNIAKTRYEGFRALKAQFTQDGSLARLETSGQ